MTRLEWGGGRAETRPIASDDLPLLLAFINEMYEPLDRLLEAICRYLGFCVEHPARG